MSLKQESIKLELVELKARLAMSYEERIEAHENARRLMLELQKAGKDKFGKP